MARRAASGTERSSVGIIGEQQWAFTDERFLRRQDRMRHLMVASLTALVGWIANDTLRGPKPRWPLLKGSAVLSVREKSLARPLGLLTSEAYSEPCERTEGTLMICYKNLTGRATPKLGWTHNGHITGAAGTWTDI